MSICCTQPNLQQSKTIRESKLRKNFWCQFVDVNPLVVFLPHARRAKEKMCVRGEKKEIG